MPVANTNPPLGSPSILSLPEPQRAEASQAADFLRWLREERGQRLDSWAELHAWSISAIEDFWESIWDWAGIRAHAPYESVLTERSIVGGRWFSGATLNYAEHCFGLPEDAATTAVIAYSQTRPRTELTFGELADQVRRVRAGLVRLGVRRGDRVVAYLPNIPETLVAFLATASIGAIWASAAPEFGAPSVIDRFAQVEPTVLLATTGYKYGEKYIDRREEVQAIRAALPTLKQLITVPYGDGADDASTIPGAVEWSELLADDGSALTFEPVPFDHPLYILFSSGTTGLPKAIVHGHGGILVEHIKNHRLHWDLGPGDRLLWFTTTAWMMWNMLVSGLLTRTTIVMIDGNPLFPDLREQWRMAEATGATLVGASPGYLMACRKAGLRPAIEFDLSRVRQIGVVGSPFPAEGYRWISEQFGDNVLLNVGSGGTDVCTGLIQSSPLEPVYIGEMAGASLGVDVKAFDDNGQAVVGELGELVIASPMPTLPLAFWGDPDHERYRATYLETYPGAFRFGDWCRFSPLGSCQITGRSDATLNRGGVRLGTAEFYRVLGEIPLIADSLVVHLEDDTGGSGELILFVVLPDDVPLDDALRTSIRTALRQALSPRHLPDTILRVPAIPYGRTGKKLEVPVKRILLGAAPSAVASADALMDPRALDAFSALAAQRREHEAGR